MAFYLDINAVRKNNDDIANEWKKLIGELFEVMNSINKLKNNVQSATINPNLVRCYSALNNEINIVNKEMLKNTEFGDFLMHEFSKFCDTATNELLAIANDFNS